ncbi:D-alanyl-D-alanine-carboxypeptidase/endopeptidase AmpH [Nitratireductor kimnyeongensis]|uniref:D-alanyl-D-alanine-carboxypeptidase/endopeptidase AmpH n=1 Tax=Nitratireductor kimnyeongensis TaxID=430679 RepID=A0ABW0T3K2_9HYPH|nr:D-alanyl-D-alanine-carboxypeptidase/endopeptidase AmpH [Nitratireductor kimnyeongensis]QZZ35187.1 D-alanyl-D-alanine-carboxypeptidase/endopeptidase AmpH [Nitratireductor kimnyeongensis]
MLHWNGRGLRAVAFALAGSISLVQSSFAQDGVLSDAVEFSGQVLYLQTDVPGLVIGAVRNGETAVFGFGETATGNGKTPNGDTLMRVGSVTKVFTGAVLASLAAEGTVKFTDRLQDHLDWDVTVPALDDKPIRLIDLATHTSGLPREVDREPGPENDPFSTLTKETYEKALAEGVQLFPAGTGGLYSNFGFDMLAAALGSAAGKPYDALLAERVLEPIGMTDTTFTPSEGDRDRLMQGHNFDGSPLPDVPNTPVMSGASGLYTTANDMVKWLKWHLDRFSPEMAEMRFLDHAAYVQRDALDPTYGFDESGQMDAMGLGWIVMQPEGDRPLILQKAGGLQGMFVYHAFAPTRGVGVFVAINEFDFSASMLMAEVVNGLISDLAPR